MASDISVIIPTFRRPRQLQDAISSVLRQTSANIDVLVVDDSPEGSARPIIDEVQDSRIVYMKNPNPSGGVPSTVRNLAWPHAKGALIHFLDDDDIVPDGYYAVAKAAFAAHPNVGTVFGRVEPFGDAPAWQLQHERDFFASAARRAAICSRFGPRLAFAATMLFEATLLVCSAAIVRRECVASLGGFDPNIRLMEDADFYARVMRRFGAYFLDQTTLHYRIGSPSLMHSPQPDELQLQREREGRRLMQTKYRKQMGTIEFYGLKILARTVLRQT
jgi:glycosyltransferase involved in cell wall biosynthesis